MTGGLTLSENRIDSEETKGEYVSWKMKLIVENGLFAHAPGVMGFVVDLPVAKRMQSLHQPCGLQEYEHFESLLFHNRRHLLVEYLSESFPPVAFSAPDAEPGDLMAESASDDEGYCEWSAMYDVNKVTPSQAPLQKYPASVYLPSQHQKPDKVYDDVSVDGVKRISPAPSCRQSLKQR